MAGGVRGGGVLVGDMGAATVGVRVGGRVGAVGDEVEVGLGVAMKGRTAAEVRPNPLASRAKARTSRTSWPSLI
ncbi:MAG: hypothetical protein H8E35_05245 [Ardenticatenia bacterium]|nr:hypothetical protein [Ardenticatenia bacterium]